MKNIFTLLILITFNGLAFGKQIDENTAKAIGHNFLVNRTNSQALKTTSNLKLTYKATSKVSSPSAKSSLINYFYVFNAEQGFIIISGDDNVYPILGYSDEGVFDPNNMPPSVAKWLEGYKDQIRYAIESELQATDEIKAEWEHLKNRNNENYTSRTVTGVSPLIRTKWDQDPYFNTLCPYDRQYSKRTVSGCVATAMAQVMKFWNYPTSGSGFHSYNHSKYGTLSANFGNTTYQWSSMPNVVSSTNTAVATLMYHCGVSVDMNYNVSSQGGSGAQTLDVVGALKTYFGYSASVAGKYRSNYSDSQWKNLLKGELDAGRPIQYAGTGSGGGHSFVCDGYDNNGYFHFNWGWGGSSDGYFSVNALNPGSLGTGGGTGGFNSNQRVIIGIKPPSGAETYNLKLYDKVSTSPSSIPYGQAFSVSTNIWNDGSNKFSGDYCAAIFDAQSNFIDYVEIKTDMSLGAGNIYKNGITFSNSGLLTMLPGTYNIGIYYKPTGGNWISVAESGSYSNFIKMTVYYYNDIEVNSAMVVTPTATDLINGQSASVNVNIKNDGDYTFYGTYSADLYDLEGNWVEEINTFTESEGLPSGYTYSSPYLTFNTSAIKANPGTYLLAIQYKPNSGDWTLTGSYYHQNPVYITVKAASIQADIYENNNAISQAYPLPITFSGNTATKNTVGSNCHTGTDYDYYKINLASGYNYSINARLHDSYNSGNGNDYTLDALFSYSTDGNSWSDAFDDLLTNNISVAGGGTVYFFVSPYYTGEMGTYLLDMSITRSKSTGTNETLNSNLIKAFPNPAKDMVILDLRELKVQPKDIQILNIHGQSVYSSPIISDQNLLEISLNEFSEGLYFIQLTSEEGTFTKKIIVTQ